MKLIHILLTVLMAAAVSGCEKRDDVALIRAAIEESVAAAERHDLDGLFAPADSGFTVMPGNHDEQSARGLLFVALRRYGKFTIEHPIPGINVDPSGDTADATLRFLVVREGEQFPDMSDVVDDPAAWAERVGEALGDPYQLEMEFTKTSDGWKVRRARMRSFGGRP